ncbi:exostosin, partial [Fischerella thermalis CCMEE 5282]
VDTDCVLPYDFKIDWKKYCVWVYSKDLPQIAEKVAEFHNNLSPEQFVELQYDCRQIWKDWLSYEGFFNNFWQHF